MLRKRSAPVSPASVLALIALFVALSGVSYAAGRIGTNAIKNGAVTAKKLHRNAVATGKVRNGAITAFKLRRNSVRPGKIAPGAVIGSRLAADSVDGSKIADGSVSNDDIDAAGMPFSQVVHEARGDSTQSITGGLTLYPLGDDTYTQRSGDLNSFVGALDVTFEAGCVQPRTVTAYLLVDPGNPLTPTVGDIAGIAQITDTGAGEVSTRGELSPYPGGKSTLFEVGEDTDHDLYIVAQGTCTAGNGVNATFGGVDVIATG